MTMPDFLLPDLGEGLEEAEIISWHVQVGDRVEVDQIVAEVETAKAVVEVPIPFAGLVSALHAEPGAVIAVGAPLISVTRQVHAQPGLREPGVVVPERPDKGSGNVLIGYGTSEAPRRPRRVALAGQTAPAPVPAPALAVESRPAPGPESAPTPGPESATARPGPVPVISPLVRKLARDGGLDLARITGTGPMGMIRRHDVEQALAAARESAEPVPPRATAGRKPGGPEPGEIRRPLQGAHKVMAEKLTRSRREIPEATVWVDADATGLLAARAALNARTPAQPVSVVALLARFAILGLRQYPELNARIEDGNIVIPRHVHLGFAAQTERGLVVPVVHDAHLRSTRELAAALAQRTNAARSGRLAPAELTGGTFTVNNYGVFGVDGSAAIINHPEVAILGLGRIIDRPWAVGGQLAVRKVTELTLAFDHRVCDGGTAGGFLRYVADCVESPVLALGEL
jgi:2-oxoisovalerate dehydrogenase E2 component (dihydrolipoyl transacylase)